MGKYSAIDFGVGLPQSGPSYSNSQIGLEPACSSKRNVVTYSFKTINILLTEEQKTQRE